LGYETISPALEKYLGISDTCGVANLHGAPGILGGLASALFSWIYLTPANAPLMIHGTKQPLWQLAGLGVTLGVAIVSGLAAGFVVSKVAVKKQEVEVDNMYDDAVFWHEVDEE
jgi:ammonium transporter Rh